MAQATPLSFSSVLSSATQPFSHQGAPVLGPATPPLVGGLHHMTNCAPQRLCVLLFLPKLLWWKVWIARKVRGQKTQGIAAVLIFF